MIIYNIYIYIYITTFKFKIFYVNILNINVNNNATSTWQDIAHILLLYNLQASYSLNEK